MFNVGPEKLILLFVIALVVLGPQRLPGAARSLGRAVAELRRLSGNLQQEVHGALGESGEALTDAVNTLRGGLGSVFTVSDGGGQAAVPFTPSPPAAETSQTAAPNPGAVAPAPGAPSRPAIFHYPETLPTPDDPSLN